MSRQRAGAERQTDRELTLARRRSREEQVGQVRAGDEEHQPDGAEEHERRRAYVPEQRRCPRRRRERPVLVLGEPPLLGLRDPPGDCRELGVGLLERRIRREPREHVELAHVARNGQRIAAPGNPEIGADENQPRRHDADDGRRRVR